MKQVKRWRKNRISKKGRLPSCQQRWIGTIVAFLEINGVAAFILFLGPEKRKT